LDGYPSAILGDGYPDIGYGLSRIPKKLFGVTVQSTTTSFPAFSKPPTSYHHPNNQFNLILTA
jgi:hypothetical protein